MVRPERFELPTAWFVARYSIQLSYGRIYIEWLLRHRWRIDTLLMVRPERFELPTAWFVARYSIQLSYGRVNRSGIMRTDTAFVNAFGESLHSNE